MECMPTLYLGLLSDITILHQGYSIWPVDDALAKHQKHVCKPTMLKKGSCAQRCGLVVDATTTVIQQPAVGFPDEPIVMAITISTMLAAGNT